MAKEFKISTSNIVEWLIRLSIVAIFVFGWNISKKLQTIDPIVEDVSKLWEMYGRTTTELKHIQKDIGRLQGRHIE